MRVGELRGGYDVNNNRARAYVRPLDRIVCINIYIYNIRSERRFVLDDRSRREIVVFLRFDTFERRVYFNRPRCRGPRRLLGFDRRRYFRSVFPTIRIYIYIHAYFN